MNEAVEMSIGWYENEGDAPDGFDRNAIFEKDGKGNFIKIEIKDDEEV